jgi:hypothetical protein
MDMPVVTSNTSSSSVVSETEVDEYLLLETEINAQPRLLSSAALAHLEAYEIRRAALLKKMVLYAC